MADKQGKREARYMVKDKDGFLMSVPASRLGAVTETQSGRDGAEKRPPLSPEELRRLTDKLVSMVYGPKE